MKQFDVVIPYSIADGRIFALQCPGLNKGNGNLLIVNLHIDPAWSLMEKKAMLRKLRDFCADFISYRIVLAGDMNFDCCLEDRQNISTQVLSVGTRRALVLFGMM